MNFLESISKMDWAAILAVVVAFNAALTGLSAFLDKIKDMTSSDLDDKVSTFLHSVIDFISKIIDICVGNKAHKDPEMQEK